VVCGAGGGGNYTWKQQIRGPWRAKYRTPTRYLQEGTGKLRREKIRPWTENPMSKFPGWQGNRRVSRVGRVNDRVHVLPVLNQRESRRRAGTVARQAWEEKKTGERARVMSDGYKIEDRRSHHHWGWKNVPLVRKKLGNVGFRVGRALKGRTRKGTVEEKVFQDLIYKRADARDQLQGEPG